MKLHLKKKKQVNNANNLHSTIPLFANIRKITFYVAFFFELQKTQVINSAKSKVKRNNILHQHF